MLGTVQLQHPVARGATSVLYGGIDLASQAPVAVKVLCPSGTLEQAAEARARFLRDAETASRLEHPHIVRVFGGGQVRGVAFMVMEWLAGSDLTRWTQPGRLLPDAVVLAIAADLADALAHAHRQGIVHRDVKPANAVFDPAAQRVVLTDLGLASLPDAEASRSGVMLGSPHYMAPELLAGRDADARSDLYALGVLLFELLAGRAPFEAPTMGALLRAVATDPPPRLQDLRGGAPGADALDELIAPLLAKDPDERPADTRAWANQARLQRLWLIAPPAS
jgi:serine/threonine-protein kinase